MYLVFDLLYLNGDDLMGVPLVRRREILKKLLPKEGPIRFSDAIEGRGIEFFRLARERGLEGIMAKRKEGRYLPGRRSDAIAWRNASRREVAMPTSMPSTLMPSPYASRMNRQASLSLQLALSSPGSRAK